MIAKAFQRNTKAISGTMEYVGYGMFMGADAERRLAERLELTGPIAIRPSRVPFTLLTSKEKECQEY